MIAVSTPTRELNKPAMNTIDVESICGLSDSQAAESLKSNGPNELPSSKPRSIWAIAAEVVREPMFILLLAAGAVLMIFLALRAWRAF